MFSKIFKNFGIGLKNNGMINERGNLMAYKFSDIESMQLVINTKDGKSQVFEMTPFLRYFLAKQLQLQVDEETNQFIISSDKELNDKYKVIQN